MELNLLNHKHDYDNFIDKTYRKVVFGNAKFSSELWDIPIIKPGEVGVDHAGGRDKTVVSVVDWTKLKVDLTDEFLREGELPTLKEHHDAVARQIADRFEQTCNDWVVRAGVDGKEIPAEDKGAGSDPLDIRNARRPDPWWMNVMGQWDHASPLTRDVQMEQIASNLYRDGLAMGTGYGRIQWEGFREPAEPNPEVNPWRYLYAANVMMSSPRPQFLGGLMDAMMASNVLDGAKLERTPERIHAEERGEALLQEVLGARDYAEFQKQGWLDIPSRTNPDRRYRIRHGHRLGMVKRMPTGQWVEQAMSLCIHPKDHWKYVVGDQVACHALLAKFDEAKLLAVANVHNVPAVGVW